MKRKCSKRNVITMKKLIEPEELKKCYMGHNGLDDKASYESIRHMIDIQPNALDLESLWKMYEESTSKEAQLEAEKETVNPEYLDFHIIEKSTQNGITNGILRCIESLSPDKKEVNRKAFEIFSRVRGLSITGETQIENESSDETEENEMDY